MCLAPNGPVASKAVLKSKIYQCYQFPLLNLMSQPWNDEQIDPWSPTMGVKTHHWPICPQKYGMSGQMVDHTP